jgi:hypothetical protein
MRTAVRRGAASCRVALRSCPVAAAARASAAGVVTAEPLWVAERRRRGNPGEDWAAQPAVAVAVAVEDVRTPATPVVARSASSVHRAGVRPMVRRTSGVHTSGVHTTVRSGCPDGYASGVRGLRPRCPHRAGCWNASVRRAASVGRNRFDVPPWGPRAAWSPARVGPAGTGWSWVGVEARTRVDGRQHPGCGPRSPPGRPRELVPCQGAGRLAGGARADQVLTSPPQVSWARCRRGRPAMDDTGPTPTRRPRSVVTLPVQPSSGGPIGFGGEQAAAAARPRYVRSAVHQVLTAR